ncbi:DUF3037 domain-containing protein [Pediococcus pentosaceus]|uniref:DUF3037 domain-containing protein n=1 Tax=Pediococcus pentosaceus TaxID=1255 RepID=UPI0018FE213A|nr:DUF3037 domain-containing protein [Pediococcus pentosaceus]MBF7130936.1 DUF3037 domain-containing protein [Pediococcus pentosaceus]
MTNKELLFSVAKYTPDLIRDESINIGIVIHVPDDSFSLFVPTKNKQRIRSFDDEYDPEYMNMVLESLEFEFNNMTLDDYSADNRFKSINSVDYIANKTKYYANELRFSKIQHMITSSKETEKDIKDLIDTYLYYDKPKNKRITKRQVTSLLKKRIKNLNLKEHIKPSDEKTKYFDTPIFDFETPSTYIKTMALDYKRETSLFDELKQSIFDVTLSDKIDTDKTINFVVNNGPDDELYTKTKEILNYYIRTDVKLVTLADYVSQIEQGIF